MDTNNKQQNLLHKKLSYEIQGAFIEVRKNFGLGHKESIYQNALAEEFKSRGLKFEKEKSIQIFSPKTGKLIGTYRPDFIIDGKILVEVKAVEKIPRMFIDQLYSYLRNSKYELGFFVNFSSPKLYVKRIIYTNDRKSWAKLSRLSVLSFVFLSVLFSVLAPSAHAATLRFSPGTGNFLVGSNFDLSIILDTKNTPVNFIETEFFFPADKLQLTSPSVGKSIIQFWPTPPVFSNQEGRVYFAGGSPAPGINVSEGLVLTLTFRVISAGEAEIWFGDKTSVLAHDGMGTEVLNQKSSAFFQFSFPPPLGPPISSPTHPDQEKWYRDNNPTFVWTKSPGAESYSFKLDQDPTGVPDTTSDSEDSTVSFSDLDNGIWYFHLREKARGVWGGVSTYAVRIDNEPPAQFRINISPSAKTTNPNPIFRFFTTDTLSGLSHWEMKIIPLTSKEITDNLFFKIESPYQADLKTGRYHVIIRAIDNAGNKRDETATVTILSPYANLAASVIRDEGIDLAFLFIPWHYFVSIIGFVFLILLFVISIWLIRQRFYIKYILKKEDIGKLFNIFKKRKNKK